LDHLETRNCELRLDEDAGIPAGWVWMLLENCGATKKQLMEAYDNLAGRNDSKWVRHGRPFHLTKCLATLLLAIAEGFSRSTVFGS
jgi:hypothetical protein